MLRNRGDVSFGSPVKLQGLSTSPNSTSSHGFLGSGSKNKKADQAFSLLDSSTKSFGESSLSPTTSAIGGKKDFSRLGTRKGRIHNLRSTMKSSVSVPNLFDLSEGGDLFDEKEKKSQDDDQIGMTSNSNNVGRKPRGSFGQGAPAGNMEINLLKSRLKKKDIEIQKRDDDLDAKEILLGELRRTINDLRQQVSGHSSEYRKLKSSRDKWHRDALRYKESVKLNDYYLQACKFFFFETSLDAMLLVDSNGYILKASPKFQEIFGWEIDEFTEANKRCITDFFTTLFASKYIDILKYLENRNIDVLNTKMLKAAPAITNKSETCMDHEDGRKIPVLLCTTTYPVPDDRKLLFNVIIKCQTSNI